MYIHIYIGISKNRALEWARNGTPEDNPEGKDYAL
jgi:hypothetical protein